MSAALVIVVLALGLAILFAWAFRHLPREHWQILAAFPRERQVGGEWRGVNLTYYGVFNALAVAAGAAVAVFLAGTADVPLSHLAWGLLAVLAICIPASRIINRLVEGHWHGFTIGGAAFIGMTVGPWLVWGVAHLTTPGDTAAAALSMLGAMASAYAVGEGIGRLACISFGCCYGRPLTDCPVWLRTAFRRWTLVFDGPLKKSSYEHGFDGQPLIPIQAITALISSIAGLCGFALFLSGHLALAYVLPIVATQVWRFASEFLRADYRGAGRISAYQRMALVGAAYTLVLGLLWPAAARPMPDVARGLALLWTPGTILLIEVLAAFVFLRMGLSTVTTSYISFHLHPNACPGLQPPQQCDGNEGQPLP
jgi:prolipoprotein diacylglyceryltransferase